MKRPPTRPTASLGPAPFLEVVSDRPAESQFLDLGPLCITVKAEEGYIRIILESHTGGRTDVDFKAKLRPLETARFSQMLSKAVVAARLQEAEGD